MFFDTHTHLNFPEFSGDLSEVVARAKDAGVFRMIVVGTDFETSVRAIEMAEKHSELFAVVGWHPSGALDAPDDIRPMFRKLLDHPKVVAVGETGLDNQRLRNSGCGAELEAQEKQVQRRLFVQHLQLAEESGLNVVVHHRQALDDVLEVMEPFRGSVRAQFHCFVGSETELRRVFEMGDVASFTGILTYKNAGDFRDVFKTAQLERVMFETDCPYLAPVPWRGKRCEPAHLMETARLAAELKEISMDDLGRITSATAQVFFPKLQ
ncbi:MAG: TatD family hydrolase [Verrucomicrobiota bacterium]|nr:TatD family hydrolase [Verrucomicrobiota bacterium]